MFFFFSLRAYVYLVFSTDISFQHQKEPCYPISNGHQATLALSTAAIMPPCHPLREAPAPSGLDPRPRPEETLFQGCGADGYSEGPNAANGGEMGRREEGQSCVVEGLGELEEEKKGTRGAGGGGGGGEGKKRWRGKGKGKMRSVIRNEDR